MADEMMAEARTVQGTRLAVLGAPIAHSLSPALHNAAYQVLGLDWQYERHEVQAGGLAGFLASLGPQWRGLSLTMPLKQEALELVGGLDRLATLTKAVNTILIDQADGTRRLSGFNTDVAGIVRVLAESGITRADHVCVLGAGATAASALAAAADLGAEDVEILVRTPAKAAHLVELGRALSLVVRIGELSEGPTTAGPGRLVVSTLPNGVAVAAPFSEGLRRESTLFDVSYSPWPSVLAASWQEAGGRVVSGLGMLLHQALVQVRIFVGGDPFAPLVNEEAVLEAMRGALDLSAGEGPTRPVEG